ncbi:hypothetical protein LJC33_07695 [Eubacteriales bacterium OttesenSCG-928-N13]|nr:hypothetical protein [Eubacteriales bacterium OttesenSCG-928-N13]
MAKDKRPTQDGQRAGMDYYEYKRLHDLERMRQRAVEVSGDVEQPEPPQEQQPIEAAPSIADRMGKLFDGIKRNVRAPIEEDIDDQPLPEDEDVEQPDSLIDEADDQPIDEIDEPIDVPADHTIYQRQPDHAADELETKETLEPQLDDLAVDDSVDEQDLTELDQMDAEPEDAGDTDDLEITNPFDGAFEKLKLFGSGIKKRAGAFRERIAKVDEDDLDEDDDEDETSASGIAEAPVSPSLTMALSQDEPSSASRRRRKQAVLAVENDDEPLDDDPLGVIAPIDEQNFTHFMRPEAAPQTDESTESAADEVSDESEEQQPMSENENKRPQLTEKLADELNAAPALSRRERKSMAMAGSVTQAASKPSEPTEEEISHPVQPVDEPTQQFKPLRARSVKAVEPDEDDLLDDEDDEDDDDIQPKRGRFSRKRPVYRDEELDDDDYEDDYEEEFEDDDYDDDDYDEYDEDDDRYHISAGKRVLGFFKGLLLIVVLLVLALITMRILEGQGIVSFNGLRSTVGQMIPLEWALPEPDAAVQPAIVEPTDAPVELPTAEPTAEPTQVPVEEPVAPVVAPQLDDIVDQPVTPEPGAEGSPLELDNLDGDGQSAG